MSRTLLVGAALLLGFALANSASAYSSYDYVDVVRPLAGELSGTFDLKDPGDDCYYFICDSGKFNPDTDELTSGRIDFILYDSQSGDEKIASIILGGGLQDAVVDADDRLAFGFYWEHFDANEGVLTQLNFDGTLGWEVILADNGVQAAGASGYTGWWCDSHDRPLRVKAAILKAGSEAAVPEPSAALLFCLGFGVVGTATRKRRTH